MKKPVEFSEHAKLQMILRGATENDVLESIRLGKWESAKRDNFHSQIEFTFNKRSPVNNKFYKFKIVDVIFADEPNKIVVITVKVYYHN